MRKEYKIGEITTMKLKVVESDSCKGCVYIHRCSGNTEQMGKMFVLLR